MLCETISNDEIRSVGEAILLYRPLPAMRAFHAGQAKNRWLCGGNRSGKSEGNIGYDLCSFALGVHPYRRMPLVTREEKAATARLAADASIIGRPNSKIGHLSFRGS